MQDFENLGDNVDYSTDRKFDFVDKLHAWADEIAIRIGFQFTHASYNQKEGRSRVSLYLRCLRYGNIKGDLHNLDNAIRSGSKRRTCRCKFVIVCSSRKPGEKPWTVRLCPGDKGRHKNPFLVYKDGHVRANKLTVDIRQHIQDFSATGMQPAFIMTSIKQNFSGFFC